MDSEEHRRLVAAWVRAYHQARQLTPLAINLDAPDATERLAESARADWAAIDAAWERVEKAKMKLDDFRVREKGVP